METQQVAIDVHVPVAADELQFFMEKKIGEVPGKPFEDRPGTIFRFPAWFYDINNDLCEPKIVSIGPYHRGKESLRAMEEYKWSTFRDFLARNKNVRIEVYLREMRLLEDQARACYSETVNLGSNDFIMMLLLDGCFIAEFFARPDASLLWITSAIISDFSLLENQMPFFVIHKLLAIQFECGQNCEGISPCSLFEKLGHCPLLQLIISPIEAVYFDRSEISCSKIHHLLHFYQKGMLHLSAERDSVSGKSNYFYVLKYVTKRLRLFLCSEIAVISSSPVSLRADGPIISKIPCVAELYEAGVTFKRKRKPLDMFDISFQNGTMEMPHIMFDDNLKNFLWNMVAYEHCQPDIPEKPFSNYLGLMDSLINTEKDVAILVRSSIIENYLPNEEQVANFFNQFDRIFQLDNRHNYFRGLYEDVTRYSQSNWNKNTARLMHDYFSNPWSAISVVAASILLILTFIQTYYSAAK